MTLDEFLAKVATEPARVFEREVVLAPSGLVADVIRSSGMSVVEFQSRSREGTAERRTLTSGHVLGAGVDQTAIAALLARLPGLVLPADLRALVERVDGIHLWADLPEGRSYEGLAPICEWELASKRLHSRPPLPASYITISYHSDGAAFVVMDADRQRYLLMDSAAPDDRSPIGTSVSDLLDWLWESRIPPESE